MTTVGKPMGISFERNIGRSIGGSHWVLSWRSSWGGSGARSGKFIGNSSFESIEGSRRGISERINGKCIVACSKRRTGEAMREAVGY